MQGPSCLMPFSPTRDQTHIPGIARWVLNHWTTREGPIHSLYVKWINFVTTWLWLHIRIILRIILLKYRPLNLLAAWKKSYDKPRLHIKNQRHYFPDKVSSSQSYGSSSGHVWMWELDYQESWALKNWCFWTWCWMRLLRVPWTARRFNSSILNAVSAECSLEKLMLKLKLQ